MTASSESSSSISRIHAGGGRIALSSHGGKAWFSELSATYPLKLLSPRLSENGVAIVYALTYGGGLVGGDRIHLSVEIESDTKLLLLSQGSTKVFKTRAQQRLASVQRSLDRTSLNVQSSPTTLQKMDFVISSNGALFLLPDPVTCFRSASYTQIQNFRTASDASLVVLDWVTSGRKSLGEDWVFSRYYSVNELMIEEKRVAKDVMLLEDETNPDTSRRLAERLSPFSCYATLILRGPLIEGTIAHLVSSTPEDIIWSLSPIGSDKKDGMIVRVAGIETELVKGWLKDALSTLEEIIGVDIYRRAFV
ncbi:UreD-domain-containing protein [Gymnopus androsaceus JB14]|uniref:UreD-domain-containing protein n=1 Tax=Gymnopus androsaceus JB14 TaxID=1447944 RepID=A0A6A4IHM3_9AGAR|nr:UreD-domain-containing protein [Gymnopus androsaceus JB14]